jgi:hypothetical protein
MENWTLGERAESRDTTIRELRRCSRHASAPAIGPPHVSPATLSLLAHFNPRHRYMSLELTRRPASGVPWRWPIWDDNNTVCASNKMFWFARRRICCKMELSPCQMLASGLLFLFLAAPHAS